MPTVNYYVNLDLRGKSFSDRLDPASPDHPGFVHVGALTVDDDVASPSSPLDVAFHAFNRVDGPNDLLDPKAAPSASVGDVFVLRPAAQGEPAVSVWLIANYGFTEIGSDIWSTVKKFHDVHVGAAIGAMVDKINKEYQANA